MPQFTTTGPNYPLIAGRWYPSSGNTTTNNAFTNGALRVGPYPLMVGQRFDRIGVEIISAAGSGGLYRLGIYRDSGYGYPGGLHLDAGTFDATIAASAGGGANEIAIDTYLAPGLWWVGGVIQGNPSPQPTVRGNAGFWNASALWGADTLSGAASEGTYVLSGVTGALPTTFTLPGAPGGSTPRVALRAAA